ARLVVFSQGAILERVAIFDVPGATTDAILVNPAASLRATNPFGVGEAVYGSGNGRAGINCAGSGLFQYRANKPTITGTVDTRIQGVNLAYAAIPFTNEKNEILHAGVIGALAGGVTRFVFPNYTENASDDIGWVLDEPAVLRNLRIRCRTAAGAGGDA